MPNGARSAVAPVYLFACLLLGGSAQGVWQNALLQVAGIAIIAWSAAWPPEEPFPRAAKPLMLLAVAAIGVVLLQCVPLPPRLWAHGFRAEIAADYAILGVPVPWLPLSLSPYASLAALLNLIPPLAMFCAMMRLRAYRPGWLAAALLAGTILGILLGALQVAGRTGASAWYLYRDTNVGAAVGFFANANHMASLLVIALPFAAALGAAGRSRNLQRTTAVLTVLAGVVLLLVVGIALNGSLAGFALACPVVAASLIILVQPGRWMRRSLGLVAIAALIGAVGLMAASSIGSTKVGADARTSVDSRAVILQTTGKAIADSFPWGSGLGSFLQVYRTYESPDTVTNEYVVHAHNDYAELALELGLPGIVLILLFLGWWAAATWSVWWNGEGGPYARGASIASAALLVHGLVEFPLRTAALATCFAMCLALLADRRRPQEQAVADLRPTRHVVIG